MSFPPQNDPLMWIIWKKTDSIEFKKTMRNFVKLSLGEAEAENLEKHFDEMTRKRKQIKDMADGKEKLTLGFIDQVLLPYLLWLQNASLHFPLNDGRINISFVWYDMTSKKKLQVPNCILEIAAILFNTACVYSFLAAHEDHATSEGLKTSVKYFGQAAGYFTAVKEKLTGFLEKLTTDLSTECLNMLINFMITQAHHCAYLQACFTMAGKHSTLAKLAQEGAVMYEDLHRMLSHPSISESIDKIWINYADFYRNVFEARAQRHTADEQLELKEMGMRISRLRKCLDFLAVASAHGKGMKGQEKVFAAFIDVLVKDTQKHLDGAIIDNDKIYHDKILPADKLPAIARMGKTVAKMIPVPQLTTVVNMSNPFSHITPSHILDAKNRFTQLVSTAIDSNITTTQRHRERMRDMLNKTGIIGVLGVEDTKVTLPKTLHSRIQKLTVDGGVVVQIADNQTRLKGCAQKCRTTIKRLKQILETEEQQDDKMRLQFGAKWTRERSSTLNSALNEKLAEYTSSVEAAESGDAILENKLKTHFDNIARLDLPASQLDALLPIGMGPAVSQDEQILISRLKSLYDQFEEKESVQQVYASELRELAAQLESQIGVQLSSVGEVARQGIIDQEKQKVDQKIQFLLQTQVELEGIVTSATASMGQLVELRRSAGGANSAREQIINDLDMSCNKFEEIMSNLLEGVHFYTSLVSQLDILSSTVEDFEFARKVQKDDFLQQIQSEAAHCNLQPAAPLPSHAVAAQYQVPSSYQPRYNQYQPQQDPAQLQGQVQGQVQGQQGQYQYQPPQYQMQYNQYPQQPPPQYMPQPQYQPDAQNWQQPQPQQYQYPGYQYQQ